MPKHPDDSEWSFPNQATSPGSPAYYAVRFASQSQRDALAMLLAWNGLIRDIAIDPVDPGVARLKLDWWRQELTRLAAGEARHPLAVGLQDLAVMREQASDAMQAIVDAAESALRSPTLTDNGAFIAACRACGGPLFKLIGLTDGVTTAEAENAEPAGAYCEAVERIRHAMTRPNRLPVALQPRQLVGLDIAQRRQRFDNLLDGLANAIPPIGPGFARRMTALQSALHAKLRAQGYAVDQQFTDRAPIAHLWTAWRAC